MGMQLIFCVETDNKCKSDYIYIRNTIEKFYALDQSRIKISCVYMAGKGNYAAPKILKKIEEKIKLYKAGSNNNVSVVIYCFDCDEYFSKPADKTFLDTAEKYCIENSHRFVWFCKDVEDVYLGKRIPDTMKKKEAETFAKKKMIRSIDIKQLHAEKYCDKKSNLCNVLDEYLNH